MVTEPSSCTARKLSTSVTSTGLPASAAPEAACAAPRRASAAPKLKLTISAPPLFSRSRRERGVGVSIVTSSGFAGPQHGVHDSCVSAATAQVSREALFDLL